MGGMTDREFFERTLELREPWKLKDVRLNLAEKRVELEVVVAEGTKWAENGALLPIVDYTERRWRHLDTMQLETTIVARVPRVRYPNGKTELVKVPWAEKLARWTIAFEALAVEVLRLSSSVSAAAKILRLSWGSADAIMQRAVARGMSRRNVGEIKSLGLDEKSFRKRHRYGTMINNLDEGKVLEVVETRSEDAATKGLESIGEDVLNGVESVAIDMSSAYENAIRAKCPNAAIVYDKFHVSKVLGDAVDKVRREEDTALRSRGNLVLKGSRYLWLSAVENLTDKQFPAFKDLVGRSLKTARAWHYRHLFSSFWENVDAEAGKAFFDRWFARAVRSKLKPMVKAARSLKRHLDGLLTYFAHPITNAMSEGLNSRIEAIKNSARGFHGFKSFRTRILFHLGGLDLAPR